MSADWVTPSLSLIVLFFLVEGQGQGTGSVWVSQVQADILSNRIHVLIRSSRL